MTEEQELDQRIFLALDGEFEEIWWSFYVCHKGGTGNLYLLWNGAWILEEGGSLWEMTRQDASSWLYGGGWTMEKGNAIW